MISGKLQGAFLTFIAKMIKPENVLEIGTFTGYSTICLAEGLPQTGKIDTIEVDMELEDIIRKYVSKSGYENQINLLLGNALEIIPNLNKSWDLVFVDADKKDYLAYYKLILPQMKKGAVMLVDNVLWSGKVLNDVPENDKDTKAIMAFNDYVQQDANVKNMILPFRDGMMLIEKL
jgi:predicted O-methyltransferase YrrM